ncbi:MULTISPECIES: hypothetical protein [unclassified Streptomyces]|uniref:hypothetical protein n=1 Tax=unclassified Streptomyces TaxID=2593676 RepID=UPI0038241778
MHAIRVASAAVLGVGALALSTALSAPASAAEGDVTPFGYSVSPTTIAAGGQVTLRIDRERGGCKGAATITSGIFASVRIAADRSTATTSIDYDVRAGTAYRVNFSCDGVSGSTDVTVAGDRPATTAPVPRGVQAGEGGSLGGFDAKEIGLGAALIAGSLGTAYHFTRRRSSEDGA